MPARNERSRSGDQVRHLIARAMDYRLRERPENEILDDLLAGLEAFAIDLDRRAGHGPTTEET